MPKIIATYVSTATDAQPPAFNTPDNALGYDDLFRQIIRHGGQPVITYDADNTYLGNGKFNQYWLAHLEGDDIVYDKHDSEIAVDILFDKNRFPHTDLKRINPEKIRQICHDKYLTYLFAPDMSATSFLVNDQTHLCTLRASHPNQRVVLKELDGLGGEKVYIGSLSDFQNDFTFPLIFQEFVDTSAGFPGLAEGLHDLRVALFNGQPIHGLLRYPAKPGELRSNLHLGGVTKALFVSDIPPVVIKLAQELDKRFETDEPRFFSVDFGYNGKEWKVFELNNAPGIWSKQLFGDANDEYLNLLAQSLVDAA